MSGYPDSMPAPTPEQWAAWLEGIAAHVRSGKYHTVRKRQAMKHHPGEERVAMYYNHHIEIATPDGFHDIRVIATEKQELP